MFEIVCVHVTSIQWLARYLFVLIFSCSAEDYFDPQPSWFDTLSINTGCLEIAMYPVRAKDLDAMNTTDSSEKPANPKISNTAESRQGTPDMRSKMAGHCTCQKTKYFLTICA